MERSITEQFKNVYCIAIPILLAFPTIRFQIRNQLAIHFRLYPVYLQRWMCAKIPQAVSEVHKQFWFAHISRANKQMFYKNYAVWDKWTAHISACFWELTYTRMSHNSAVEQNKFYMPFKVKHKLYKHRTHTPHDFKIPSQMGVSVQD